jgi:hypothetical protein
MFYLCLCSNFHSKPEVPFHQGLSLPLMQLLSVNQGKTLDNHTLLRIITLGKAMPAQMPAQRSCYESFVVVANFT